MVRNTYLCYTLVWSEILRYYYTHQIIICNMRWKIFLVLHWWIQVGLLFSRANFYRRGDKMVTMVMTVWILTRIVQITSKGGWTCNGVCSKMASSYNFCEIRGKASFFEKSWWDFCTPKWSTKKTYCEKIYIGCETKNIIPNYKEISRDRKLHLVYLHIKAKAMRQRSGINDVLKLPGLCRSSYMLKIRVHCASRCKEYLSVTSSTDQNANIFEALPLDVLRLNILRSWRWWQKAWSCWFARFRRLGQCDQYG